MFVRFDPDMPQDDRRRNKPVKTMQLARAYVPAQPYGKLFPLDKALHKGTLFVNLWIPFEIKEKE